MDDCWFWAGYQFVDGYGGIWSTVRNQYERAHRVIYESVKGDIPEGLQLHHICHNRLCVNPDHLTPVTIKENVLLGNGIAAQYARRTHCIRGHEFSEGSRNCEICNRIRWAKYRKNNLEKVRERQRIFQYNKYHSIKENK
jgi:hypothetical protein